MLTASAESSLGDHSARKAIDLLIALQLACVEENLVLVNLTTDAARVGVAELKVRLSNNILRIRKMGLF